MRFKRIIAGISALVLSVSMMYIPSFSDLSDLFVNDDSVIEASATGTASGFAGYTYNIPTSGRATNSKNWEATPGETAIRIFPANTDSCVYTASEDKKQRYDYSKFSLYITTSNRSGYNYSTKPSFTAVDIAYEGAADLNLYTYPVQEKITLANGTTTVENLYLDIYKGKSVEVLEDTFATLLEANKASSYGLDITTEAKKAAQFVYLMVTDPDTKVCYAGTRTTSIVDGSDYSVTNHLEALESRLRNSEDGVDPDTFYEGYLAVLYSYFDIGDVQDMLEELDTTSDYVVAEDANGKKTAAQGVSLVYEGLIMMGRNSTTTIKNVPCDSTGHYYYTYTSLSEYNKWTLLKNTVNLASVSKDLVSIINKYTLITRGSQDFTYYKTVGTGAQSTSKVHKLVSPDKAVYGVRVLANNIVSKLSLTDSEDRTFFKQMGIVHMLGNNLMPRYKTSSSDEPTDSTTLSELMAGGYGFITIGEGGVQKTQKYQVREEILLSTDSSSNLSSQYTPETLQCVGNASKEISVVGDFYKGTLKDSSLANKNKAYRLVYATDSEKSNYKSGTFTRLYTLLQALDVSNKEELPAFLNLSKSVQGDIVTQEKENNKEHYNSSSDLTKAQYAVNITPFYASGDFTGASVFTVANILNESIRNTSDSAGIMADEQVTKTSDEDMYNYLYDRTRAADKKNLIGYDLSKVEVDVIGFDTATVDKTNSFSTLFTVTYIDKKNTTAVDYAKEMLKNKGVSDADINKYLKDITEFTAADTSKSDLGSGDGRAYDLKSNIIEEFNLSADKGTSYIIQIHYTYAPAYDGGNYGESEYGEFEVTIPQYMIARSYGSIQATDNLKVFCSKCRQTSSNCVCGTAGLSEAQKADNLVSVRIADSKFSAETIKQVQDNVKYIVKTSFYLDTSEYTPALTLNIKYDTKTAGANLFTPKQYSIIDSSMLKLNQYSFTSDGTVKNARTNYTNVVAYDIAFQVQKDPEKDRVYLIDWNPIDTSNTESSHTDYTKVTAPTNVSGNFKTTKRITGSGTNYRCVTGITATIPKASKKYYQTVITEKWVRQTTTTEDGLEVDLGFEQDTNATSLRRPTATVSIKDDAVYNVKVHIYNYQAKKNLTAVDVTKKFEITTNTADGVSTKTGRNYKITSNELTTTTGVGTITFIPEVQMWTGTTSYSSTTKTSSTSTGTYVYVKGNENRTINSIVSGKLTTDADYSKFISTTTQAISSAATNLASKLCSDTTVPVVYAGSDLSASVSPVGTSLNFSVWALDYNKSAIVANTVKDINSYSGNGEASATAWFNQLLNGSLASDSNGDYIKLDATANCEVYSGNSKVSSFGFTSDADVKAYATSINTSTGKPEFKFSSVESYNLMVRDGQIVEIINASNSNDHSNTGSYTIDSVVKYCNTKDPTGELANYVTELNKQFRSAMENQTNTTSGNKNAKTDNVGLTTKTSTLFYGVDKSKHWYSEDTTVFKISKYTTSAVVSDTSLFDTTVPLNAGPAVQRDKTKYFSNGYKAYVLYDVSLQVNDLSSEKGGTTTMKLISSVADPNKKADFIIADVTIQNMYD